MTPPPSRRRTAAPSAESSGRSLSRLAAGAVFGAVAKTGASVTREFSGPAEDTLGLGPFVITFFWSLAAVLLAMLVLPTWRGSAICRRILGAATLAGFAGALHWLSYEPGDAQGFAVGISVAALFGVSTAGAALAEGRTGLTIAVTGGLALAFTAGLWRAHASYDVFAVDAALSVSADGRTVRSDFVTGHCSEPLRLEVVETAQDVRVLTLVRIDRGFPTGCGDAPVPQRLEAVLDAPLGARALRPM